MNLQVALIKHRNVLFLFLLLYNKIVSKLYILYDIIFIRVIVMKKIRMFMLSLASFSVFYSIFWYIFSLVYDHSKEHQYDGGTTSFMAGVKIPFAANIITIVIMFALVLIWYIYHKKDRTESVSNFIIFIICAIYLAFFIKGIADIFDGDAIWFSNWGDYSLAILLTSGFPLAVLVVPAFLHLIASFYTGGFDNVGEPYNIYGFIFTSIGVCYIPFFLIINFTNNKALLLDVFALNENGLIYTLIILTFVLCAGLRFNAITINIINIVMNFGFIISWIVIMAIHSDSAYIYLCSLNLIMAIPQAVLSIFILKHYIQVDRFYKGQTKNFLND